MQRVADVGEFSAAAGSNDRFKISHLNDGSRSAGRTKFCPSFGLRVRRRPAQVFESNFLRYNLTAFNRFPFGIYLDSMKPLVENARCWLRARRLALRRNGMFGISPVRYCDESRARKALRDDVSSINDDDYREYRRHQPTVDSR